MVLNDSQNLWLSQRSRLGGIQTRPPAKLQGKPAPEKMPSTACVLDATSCRQYMEPPLSQSVLYMASASLCHQLPKQHLCDFRGIDGVGSMGQAVEQDWQSQAHPQLKGTLQKWTQALSPSITAHELSKIMRSILRYKDIQMMGGQE